MKKLFSLSHLTAGFVAVMVGYTSSVAIIYQAAIATGATNHEVSSWLLVLGIGMGVTSIGLSLRYRMPIFTAWSTPGAALLATSLIGVSLSDAIGIFIFSACLIILVGVTGWFEKAMNHIPRSFGAAMLAGILFHFGTNIFSAMQQQFILVGAMFIFYLLGKRLFPRFVILLVLLLGVVIESTMGSFHLTHVHLILASPIFTTPTFSLAKLIGIGIPLFIVTMASQNIPGIVTIHAAGYRPPISPLISWTGVINLLLAPFGGYALNLAALSAAICLSEEADRNTATRYKAAVAGGIFYLVLGILGATVVAFFTALPKELVMAVAGLALLGTIANSLKIAVEDDAHREPALIIFLVSASGISLLGISAAFWGLFAGILASLLLRANKPLAKPA